MWWREILIIKKNLELSKPGIRKDWQFLRWSGRIIKILKDDILTLRVHSISLDKVGLYKIRQIEIDYQVSETKSLNTFVMFREQKEDLDLPINSLIQDIQDILELSTEIEYTEASRMVEYTR